MPAPHTTNHPCLGGPPPWDSPRLTLPLTSCSDGVGGVGGWLQVRVTPQRSLPPRSQSTSFQALLTAAIRPRWQNTRERCAAPDTGRAQKETPADQGTKEDPQRKGTNTRQARMGEDAASRTRSRSPAKVPETLALPCGRAIQRVSWASCGQSRCTRPVRTARAL